MKPGFKRSPVSEESAPGALLNPLASQPVVGGVVPRGGGPACLGGACLGGGERERGGPRLGHREEALLATLPTLVSHSIFSLSNADSFGGSWGGAVLKRRTSQVQSSKAAVPNRYTSFKKGLRSAAKAVLDCKKTQKFASTVFTSWEIKRSVLRS